jgi:hypothetical protein
MRLRLRVVETTGLGLDLAADPKRIAVPVFDEVRRNSHHTAFSTECTAGPATQCRSNPVSGPRLKKTGIFQTSAADCRQFRCQSDQIGSLETGYEIAKARRWRAFLPLQRVKFLSAELVGWRRSADRTCLHANSLLYNREFYREFLLFSALCDDFGHEKLLCRRDFSPNSLGTLTGKSFRGTGNFLGEI